MIAILEFVVGIGVALLFLAIEDLDRQATAFCAQRAQRHVDNMRAEADARVWETYAGWESAMSPQTRAAYRQRLGL
ncbi:MAG: hypothetical protein HY905_04140 [Deltaproteobacteria bacterium]|nr:hypothetical protein [Deltaproteobacteria bacterium]